MAECNIQLFDLLRFPFILINQPILNFLRKINLHPNSLTPNHHPLLPIFLPLHNILRQTLKQSLISFHNLLLHSLINFLLQFRIRLQIQISVRIRKLFFVILRQLFEDFAVMGNYVDGLVKEVFVVGRFDAFD